MWKLGLASGGFVGSNAACATCGFAAVWASAFAFVDGFAAAFAQRYV